MKKNTKNPIKSFSEKKGWNGILNDFLFTPKGLLDPFKWRKNKWKITINKTINGVMKWKTKNRLSVALSTEKPPQIQYTSICPK